MILVDHNEVDDDDESPTYRHSLDMETESPTDSPADVDRSRYHHRHARNADTGYPVCSTQDDLPSPAADDGDDHRTSTWVSRSVDGDLERRKSGFQRRRLGQLQLKHRLAIDLPENGSPATRGSHLEESGFTVDSQTLERGNETIVGMMWNSLDDCDYQFYVVFVVALAALATALNVPPSWLIIAVAALSLLYFGINERLRRKPQ